MVNSTSIERAQRAGLLALATAAIIPVIGAAGACADPNAPPPNIGQSSGPTYPPQPGYGPQPSAGSQPGAYPTAPATGYQPPPGYAQQPPPPGASGAPTAQGPLGPIVTTDPAQLQAMFAQAAQAAQAFLQPPGSAAPKPSGAPAPAPAPGGMPGIPGGMPTDLTDAGIRALALIHAQGMQPEGSQAKGQLAEGGHLEFMVPMQAGKCYTLIGFSPPGQVRNLDLNLLAPPFYNVLAGQDTSDDNSPVIGKGPNPMCPIVPVPLNYKVDIVAHAGAGQVGVQLYSRTK
jgi:hypothetical protein